MNTVTFKGDTVSISGTLPEVGSNAPDFTLTKTDLSEISAQEMRGGKVVLNIFPSLDTDVCAASVRRFNQEAAAQPDVTVLCISMDLPFAQARFCGAEGLSNVIPCSDFRTGRFARDYGVLIEDSPLQGLMTRAVVVFDKSGIVQYTELVPEITTEPDYAAAMAAVQKA